LKKGHFTSLLCLLIFTAGCSERVRDDLWSHCVFSAAGAGALTASHGGCLEGAAVAVGFGVLKEVYDAFRGSGFGFDDLTADIAGGILGAVGARVAMEGSFCLRR
jgi:uncharacterized protein YfiM (DUF2279 family)